MHLHCVPNFLGSVSGCIQYEFNKNAGGSVNIIDAHNHIWHCQGEHFSWISNDMAVIRRDFLISDLLKELNENNVEGSILVQATPSVSETEWLLEIAEQTNKIKGVIGWVDITQGQAVKQELERLIFTYNKLKGIRFMSQGLPPEHLLTPEFIQGVRCVGEHGLVYELLITSTQLDAASKLISECPDVTFVIEHIAKPSIRSGEIVEWKEKMHEIGSCNKNVFCKLSGMTTEANYKDWKELEQAYQEIEPYMNTVFSAFGEDRVLYGSDWPVSLLALPYASTLVLCKRYLQANASISSNKLFHSVSEKVYSLK